MKIHKHQHQNNQFHQDGQQFLSHGIVFRPDHEDELNEDASKVIDENLFVVVSDLLKKAGEEDFKILRANINITFRSASDRKIAWHCDHAFDYKHFIFYLTSHDDAPTVVKNDDGSEVVVDAVANRAVFFERQLHRATTPKHGIRAIIVVTYKPLN